MLHLRPLTPADLPAVAGVYADPRTTRYLQDGDHTEAGLERITRLDAEQELPVLWFAAVVGENFEDFVGFARLACARAWRDDLPASDYASVGFALRADRTRQGLGTELLRSVEEVTWERTAATHLWGATDPDNAASAALLRSRGFRVVDALPVPVRRGGVLRPSDVHLKDRP